MTLEALRCLRTVVEAGTFRGAALKLHRTQSAVSQTIKALELECGHTLVDRHDCRPTPAGRLIYDRACRILAETEDLTREIRQFDEDAAAELRLGTSDTTALYVLPKSLRTFTQRFPQSRVVVVNRSSDAIADLVTRGELDLGIVTLPLGHADLDEQALFTEDLVLVAPAGHSVAAKGEVDLNDLRDEPLLQLDQETRTGRLLRDHFSRNGFQPRVALHSGSFEVIKRYVLEGMGLAFLPALTITAADTGLAVARVPGLPRVRIGAIWRRGAYRSKAQLAFLELLGSRTS